MPPSGTAEAATPSLKSGPSGGFFSLAISNGILSGSPARAGRRDSCAFQVSFP
jgi:hypothetical protein